MSNQSGLAGPAAACPEIAIGMEVTVAFNISMDLDVTNRACGHVVDIVLDAQEELSTVLLRTMDLQ